MLPWNETFLKLYDRCCGLYRSGNRNWQAYYSADDLAFLGSIGCQRREFFDFVEDGCDEGQPGVTTALLIAAVRRDYFHVVQLGVPSETVLRRDELPTFGDALGGIPYLPRILAKARAKLRGELDPDIMYCCGGDRSFLARHGHIHPADFLRRVWAAGDDDGKVLAWLTH